MLNAAASWDLLKGSYTVAAANGTSCTWVLSPSSPTFAEVAGSHASSPAVTSGTGSLDVMGFAHCLPILFGSFTCESQNR